MSERGAARSEFGPFAALVLIAIAVAISPNAGGQPKPGKTAEPVKLELFGVPLKGASREQLREAFLKNGLRPIRVDNNYRGDTYDAEGVLDGASTFEAYYVRKTETFAVAEYKFPGFMDTQLVTRVITLVTNKYGRPTSRRGDAGLGPVTATWNMGQGMFIEVSRSWPDTTTSLIFVDEKGLAAVRAEQKAHRDQQDRERAKSQSKAF